VFSLCRGIISLELVGPASEVFESFAVADDWVEVSEKTDLVVWLIYFVFRPVPDVFDAIDGFWSLTVGFQNFFEQGFASRKLGYDMAETVERAI